MSDGFSPVKGKCTWWREKPVDEDLHNITLKPGECRIACSCFVEGKGWTFVSDEVPSECPEDKHCRYYIKCW